MEIAASRYSVDSEEDSSSVSRTSSICGSDQRQSLDDVLPEWQCKYTGKICPNVRARKTNGKLHRLCEEHRIRANVNQRNLQQKRREARARTAIVPYPANRSPGAAEPLTEPWESWFARMLRDDHSTIGAVSAAKSTASVTPEPLTSPAELTDEDVEALTLLLTSSISTDSTNDEICDVMNCLHPERSLN